MQKEKEKISDQNSMEIQNLRPKKNRNCLEIKNENKIVRHKRELMRPI